MPFLCLLLIACQPAEKVAQQTTFSGPIMGTEYQITVIHNGSQDLAVVEQRVIEAMQAVNQSMSNYLDDSELSRFNRRAAHQPMTISDDFSHVVEESIRIGRVSNGAFDITLGKVVNLWGFGPDGRIMNEPSDVEISALRQSVGYQKLILDNGQLAKTHDQVTLNLSAIAKGYAIDRVADVLRSLGINRFLVNIGGELKASGLALNNNAWRVGIEKPHILGGIQQVVTLRDQAIATSGDYRNYLTIDGQQFSHMIDPSTLMPVYHRLASVTVISQQASTADAQATAMMAMGKQRAIDYAERENLAVYMIIRGEEKGQYEVYVNDKFRPNLQ